MNLEARKVGRGTIRKSGKQEGRKGDFGKSGMQEEKLCSCFPGFLIDLSSVLPASWFPDSLGFFL
jgi:hypothetical protein